MSGSAAAACAAERTSSAVRAGRASRRRRIGQPILPRPVKGVHQGGTLKFGAQRPPAALLLAFLLRLRRIERRAGGGTLPAAAAHRDHRDEQFVLRTDVRYEDRRLALERE